MRVLMITTEYPTEEFPGHGIFVARQVRTLRTLGVEIDVLHFLSRGNPVNHIHAWRRMRAMRARKRYDVIHAQFGHAGLAAGLQRGTPTVLTFRGPDLQGVPGPGGRQTMKGRLLVAMCHLASRMAAELVVVSDKLGQRLGGRQYELIPSGIDLDVFREIPRDAARRELGWDPGLPVVLYAAQDPSMPGKRYDLASDVVDLVSREVDLRFEVASNVPPDRMPVYMSASDALLVTSAAEGSPNVVKEALACNLPVVSVDTGDVVERLEGVDPSSVCDSTPEALAAALAPLLQSPRRSNGRPSIMHLSETLQCQRLIKVYDRATSG